MSDLIQQVKSKAQKWLESPVVDDESKKQIQVLLNNADPKELIDSFYKDLEFGTGGLRGIMGVGSNCMNKYTVGVATQGFANYFKKVLLNQEIKVAIAYDCRNNSKFFAETTANIFSANGITV